MCNVKPIRTEADFDAALARLYDTIDAEPGTPEGDEHELLAGLVALYDDQHHAIGPPKPSVATDIEFWMDRQGCTLQELNAQLGAEWDIAAIMAGKQTITIPMAKVLYERLEVRPESLFKAMVLDAPVAGPTPAGN